MEPHASKSRYRARHALALSIALVVAVAALAAPVSAYQAQSSNYRLEQGVTDSFGGTTSSSSYQLTDGGGEAFVGPGQSTNYRFNAGFVATLEHAITLSVDVGSLALTGQPGGASVTAPSSLGVRTDAPGYQLWIAQNHDLRHTDAVTTIPAMGGTIAAPTAWTEGTTTGLGFTLTSGTGLDPKWGTSPNFAFAAVPNAATTAHSKSGYQGTADATTVRYRLQVPATQKPGSYSNLVTYTATGRVV